MSRRYCTVGQMAEVRSGLREERQPSGAGWVARGFRRLVDLRLVAPERTPAGPLPPLSEEERRIAERIRAHVGVLAGAIGERNFWRYEALLRAAEYIEDTLRSAGCETRRQEFRARWLMQTKPVANVEGWGIGGAGAAAEAAGPVDGAGEAAGMGAREAGQAAPLIVVGAHYDSRFGTPGANDNATGVAAVLEIARLLAGRKSARRLRFVAFVNEEFPFARTRSMGSRRYVEELAARGEGVAGMLAVETIGCYRDEPGSQRYPWPVRPAGERRGDFVAFAADRRSRGLVERGVELFGRHAAFPCLGVTARGVYHLGRSDHWSFGRRGVPAVMVTDTAPFRYPYYHRAEDTPDKIDYERVARVTTALAAVAAELADEPPTGDSGGGATA